MPANSTEAAPASPISDAPQDYRYRNSKPWSVLGLSIIASVIAVAVIAGAWSGLSSATEDDRIAAPPDLRKVVTKAGATGEKIVDDAKTALTDRERGNSPDHDVDPDLNG